MTVDDKRHKLSKSIEYNLGVNSTPNDMVCVIIYDNIKIKAARFIDGILYKETIENFNTSWSLEDWKAFRDRCVNLLR